MSLSARISRRSSASGLSLDKLKEDRSSSSFQLLKPEAKARHSVHTVTFKHTHTIIRVCPQPDPEDPKGWSPPLLLAEDGETLLAGSWLHMMTIAPFVGPAKYTFVCDSYLNPTYRNPNDVPYRLVCYAASQGHREGTAPADWVHCTPKVKGKNKNLQSWLQWPEEAAFVQGVLYEHGSIPQLVGLDEKEPLPILRMTKAASETLITLITTESDKCPDFVSWLPDVETDNGGFLGFSQLKTGPRKGTRGHDFAEPVIGTYSPFSKDENGYDVYIYPSYGQESAIYDEDTEDMLKAKVTPWDDVFWVPTAEEQIDLLVGSGLPASLLVKALDERYGSCLPNDIRNAGQRALGWGGQSQVPADIQNDEVPWQTEARAPSNDATSIGRRRQRTETAEPAPEPEAAPAADASAARRQRRTTTTSTSTASTTSLPPAPAQLISEEHYPDDDAEYDEVEAPVAEAETPDPEPEPEPEPEAPAAEAQDAEDASAVGSNVVNRASEAIARRRQARRSS